MRYPRLYPAGRRVSAAVSTRRVFHSVLEAAAISPNGENPDRAPVDVEGLSLTRAIERCPAQEETVFAEAYTPDTLLALMENENPSAIDTFRCRSMRRAAYEDRHKLITVGDEPDELFDVLDDPRETRNLLAEHPSKVARLRSALDAFASHAEARRPANWEEARKLSLDDTEISQRLRALGYIE
jgi:uncharacterized sulfatase